MSNASTPAVVSYFDLHTFAVGYVNDIREVPVRKGSFLACRFTALRPGEEEGNTRFDLKVVGAHAKACIKALQPLSEAGKAVLVGVKIGDVYPEHFQYKTGKREGEYGVNIKGRMLKVYDASVDGQTVELPPMPYSADAKVPPVGLVTSGVGYLNRIARVHLGEGAYVWMAAVSALRGDASDKVENTYFNLAISPDEMESAMVLQDAVLAKKKVLIGFQADNIRAELFQYQRGEKKGQMGAVLKGVLAHIPWAKVDGVETSLPGIEKAA